MTVSAATNTGTGEPLKCVSVKVVSAITTPTCAVPVTPSMLARIVVDPGPTAMRKPGDPTTLSGDPMMAINESSDLNVTVRPVIARSPWPRRGPRPARGHRVPGSLFRRQLHSLHDQPADHEIVYAGSRATSGGDADSARARSAKLPSPAILARVVSLTVHVTGAVGTSAPASSMTFALRRTTSPSNTLSATGTILTAGPAGRGAAASPHATIARTATRANAARAARFAGE